MQTTHTMHQHRPNFDEIVAWLVDKIASYVLVEASDIDHAKSFASYGLSSIDAVGLSGEIEEWLDCKLSPTLLYDYPTVARLALALVDDPVLPKPFTAPISQQPLEEKTHEIAIIGMAGRFPGAANVDEFWHNLRSGVESVTFFSTEELLASGNDAETIQRPDYIRARPVLPVENVECFDAAFFGYSPHEATFTDPQHRLFLECSWEALERAGYAPGSYPGLVSVYAGCSLSTYMLSLLVTGQLQAIDDYQLVIGNDKDSLASTVSYKLDLKGPSFTVQTFCSTSLVAVHLACQSLLHGECDLALAGGVSVRVPGQTGYLYQAGGMESEDGHCRAFDSQATGTPFGDGAGVVVLKRLQDALRDGDTIDAVIKGSAINNDGSLKVSYTAPSVIGQATAISKALEQAGIEAATLGYVEAHGSATELGDPIEVAALTHAFRQQTPLRNYCGLGSVKTNVGHLDRAAGVAGLMKVALALKHQEIPPTLHVQETNPRLDLAQSPFFLATHLRSWPEATHPRRGSVNSLGLGGTNAHVILEEAPGLPETSSSRSWQLLVLSAQTATALEQATHNLRQYLQTNEQVPLADVAYTLQAGRQKFEQRRIFLCQDRQEALRLLAQPAPPRMLEQRQRRTDCQTFFLLPGVGEQTPYMAHELYQQEPFFRQEVDRCCEILLPLLKLDLRTVLYPDHTTLALAGNIPASAASNAYATQQDFRSLLRLPGSSRYRQASPLDQTELSQPAVFVIEYALAQLLIYWGIQPQGLLGYSLGEYVAATLAGVLSLEDALTLVARRAQFIATQAQGALLSVALSEAEMQAYLVLHPELEVELAIIAAPQASVMTGSLAMIEHLERCLAADELACFRVESTHAFHSHLLSPVREQLILLLQSMVLHPPTIPYISNVTGTWITNEQAINPEYWAEHMCGTVRFMDGVECLLQQAPYILVEVGIGQTLGSFVRQHPACDRERMTKIIATQPASGVAETYAFFLTGIGRLWLAGVELDWSHFYAGERRRRIPLPTYPFERQRYWIDGVDWRSRPATLPVQPEQVRKGKRKNEIATWFSVPGWKQAPLSPVTHVQETSAGCCIIFQDQEGIGERLASHFQACGQQIVIVTAGSTFDASDTHHYQLNPTAYLDYQHLFQTLHHQKIVPTHILHCWSLANIAADPLGVEEVQQQLDLGFYSVLALVQALGEIELEHCILRILAHGISDVLGQESLAPARATMLGLCRVIPQEYANISCQLVDLELPDPDTSDSQERLLEQLIHELTGEPTAILVALRGRYRWLPNLEVLQLPEPLSPAMLRQRGVYLLLGGLGGIGLALATHLAKYHARLVLTSRQGLPARDAWSGLLQTEQEASTIRQQITTIQALEQLGAEVLILAADVTEELQMQHVIEQTLGTFGELHGVFHLAGVPGVGLLQLKTHEAAAAVLAPKVQGTLILHRLLQDIPLDFLLLFSSITTLIGGHGQGDYSAANAFLDAYAHSHDQSSYPVMAVDWGEWQWNAWSAGLAGYSNAMRSFFEDNRRTFGISFEEGAAALERLLAFPRPQVIVSTQDLQDLIHGSQTLYHSHQLGEDQQSLPNIMFHTRPPLNNSYTAPRDEHERAMTQIWERVLAIDGIGIYDNFFDLGGNSLLGVSLLLQVRKTFNLERLPAYSLYEAPCIEAFTQYLTQNHSGVTLNALEERSSKRQSLLKKRMHEKSK
ncbi:type I polyketide synthase [Dictyobacter alpinus]|nr:type I polyketide synthase [Dictyobacter alpinus]